jgi:hypothetical protein
MTKIINLNTASTLSVESLIFPVVNITSSTTGITEKMTVSQLAALSVGPTGSTGFFGSLGIIGYAGSRGATGFGSQGFAGSVGSQGFAGSVGNGFVGSSGAFAAMGYNGSIGGIGYVGSAGRGFSGSRGDLGGSGFTGSNGIPGSIGYVGSSGSQSFSIQSEGMFINSTTISVINFVGDGVSAAAFDDVATITISNVSTSSGVSNSIYDAGTDQTVVLDYNNGQWQHYEPVASTSTSTTINVTVSNIPEGGEMTIFLKTGEPYSAVVWNGVSYWEDGISTVSTASGVYNIINIKRGLYSYTYGNISKNYIP